MNDRERETAVSIAMIFFFQVVLYSSCTRRGKSDNDTDSGLQSLLTLLVKKKSLVLLPRSRIRLHFLPAFFMIRS